MPKNESSGKSQSPSLSSSLSFTPSRRQFIFGSAIVAAAGLVGLARHTGLPGLGSALAQNAPAGASDADFAAFMRLSQYLTGKTSLDVEIGHAIFAGLVDGDPHFTQQVTQLNDFVASSKTPANGLQQVLDSSQPTLASVPKRVMPAWYLGVVGTGAKARTVAYEQALMYPPIADVIVMPSFARGVPGYWAQPPRLSQS
ncbi:Membrane bound FAD containing D-sorbitol dehydrogenase [Paraburkholderia fungorum]|uniref:Membrane bound FAD containing D-sorbitol dehydrogenase n=1 Tax=Paraburkholderia fungorum TaxID=134537 RepID=A0A1H1C0S4_9BURK|nr:sugar dehydrogenase complex small subunit [Paraburkholderia fungorum]SDQ57246.1 Membrane bound FAD containing D-sorbitol dehydrogenase [Paraburkholderia fungorum]